MKGTTGQKRRTKTNQKTKPRLSHGSESHGPNCTFLRFFFFFFPILFLFFNLNGVPRFGTINKERMKQFQFGILIVAVAKNSESQRSRFSGTPSVRS